MNRKELNEAMLRYLADGGKVTKLPDGPDTGWKKYDVRVPISNNVDLTLGVDPANKKQASAFERNSL
tara:strand:+ start:294 stop:494 length:201 start_codon:yes stop_codon:yes gene_type:complete